MFKNWQLESDVLVLGRLQADQIGARDSSWGLYLEQPNVLGVLDRDGQSAEQISAQNPTFVPYASSLGLQGTWASILTHLGFTTLHKQQMLNAGLFALIFSVFVVLLARLTSRLFAGILGIVAISSAWVVAAAHSLFWVTWSWYLPLVFLAAFTLAPPRRWPRYLFAGLTVLSFVFRFGSGYEFITSFALFAAALPLLSRLLSAQPRFESWRQTWIESAKCFGMAVLGFLIAFIWHAGYRGKGNLTAGAIDILNNDILRRTYGDASAFANPEIQASLNASPLSVLFKYLFGWKTDFLSVGYGAPFDFVFGTAAPWALLALSASIICLLWLQRVEFWKTLAGVLLISTAVSFSWYILAKGHAYIHVQIDYILWYLLLAPAVIFIPLVGLHALWKSRATRDIGASPSS